MVTILNLHITKAEMLLNSVVGATMVAPSLILEDDAFSKLLADYARNQDFSSKKLQAEVKTLCDYINANY